MNDRELQCILVLHVYVLYCIVPYCIILYCTYTGTYVLYCAMLKQPNPILILQMTLFQSIPIYSNLFQSIPIHSNLLQSITIHSNLFQSIPIHSNPKQSPLTCSLLSLVELLTIVRMHDTLYKSILNNFEGGQRKMPLLPQHTCSYIREVLRNSS